MSLHNCIEKEKKNSLPPMLRRNCDLNENWGTVTILLICDSGGPQTAYDIREQIMLVIANIF